MGNDLFETLLYLCSGGQAWDAKLHTAGQVDARSGTLTDHVLACIFQGFLSLIWPGSSSVASGLCACINFCLSRAGKGLGNTDRLCNCARLEKRLYVCQVVWYTCRTGRNFLDVDLCRKVWV